MSIIYYFNCVCLVVCSELSKTWEFCTYEMFIPNRESLLSSSIDIEVPWVNLGDDVEMFTSEVHDPYARTTGA